MRFFWCFATIHFLVSFCLCGCIGLLALGTPIGPAVPGPISALMFLLQGPLVFLLRYGPFRFGAFGFGLYAAGSFSWALLATVIRDSARLFHSEPRLAFWGNKRRLIQWACIILGLPLVGLLIDYTVIRPLEDASRRKLDTRALVRRGRVDDSDMSRLTQMPDLEELTVNGRITDAGLLYVATLRKLRVLDASGARITDAGLVFLSDLDALEEVNLGHTAVQGPGLAHMAHLPRLRRLVLSNLPVRDAALAEIGCMTHLEELRLDLTLISDKGLEHLAGLTRLHELDVCGTEVTGVGFRHLANSKGLRRLVARRTRVDDDGMGAIARLTGLVGLDLEGTGVTDAGLAKLKDLKNLQDVNLRGSRVSPEGARRLQAQLPECRVDFWDPARQHVPPWRKEPTRTPDTQPSNPSP